MKLTMRRFSILLAISALFFFGLLLTTQRSNYYDTKIFNVRAESKLGNFSKISIQISPPKNNVENIPNIYLEIKPKTPTKYNKTCALFPKLLDIKFANDHWQTQNTSNGTLFLLNAYLDNRGSNNVRIVGMFDQIDFRGTFHCQFWYDKVNEPKIVESEKVYWIWRKGWGGNSTGVYHPYLITCPLKSYTIPMSVSVVGQYCDNPTNNLRISYKEVKPKNQKNVMVCVKGLNFPYEDQSLRMIEWMELLFILGADKITFYEFAIHPDTKQVLDYYVSRGKVEIIPINLIGGASNNPYLQSRYLHEKVINRRLQEVIPYNDCLYRNLQEYKFINLLDTDEIIIPAAGTWIDLLKKIKKKAITTYIARNVYFLDSHLHDHGWFEGIPHFMHMLQHVYRAKNYTKPGHYVKGFHDTSQVMVLHNHFAFACLTKCSSFSIDVADAHLQHYRTDCVKEVKDCSLMKNNSVLDTRIWNHKAQLIRRVADVLDDLQYLNIGVDMKEFK